MLVFQKKQSGALTYRCNEYKASWLAFMLPPSTWHALVPTNCRTASAHWQDCTCLYDLRQAHVFGCHLQMTLGGSHNFTLAQTLQSFACKTFHRIRAKKTGMWPGPWSLGRIKCQPMRQTSRLERQLSVPCWCADQFCPGGPNKLAYIRAIVVMH